MSALADMPAVLTVEEAAKVLRIGRTAAYDAVRRGDLPVIRVGRILRVPRHRLEQLLGELPLNEPSPAEEPGLTPPHPSTGADGQREGYRPLG